jgi:hypothetical protein
VLQQLSKHRSGQSQKAFSLSVLVVAIKIDNRDRIYSHTIFNYE